jgi:hypothetical protein
MMSTGRGILPWFDAEPRMKQSRRSSSIQCSAGDFIRLISLIRG